MKRYNEAKEMASAYGDELKELEDTLNVMNSTTVSRYCDLYERKGGEQFCPDPSRFTCEGYILFLEMTREIPSYL